jgi:glycosyltransferase involved in cell wall biosynthesis
LNYKKIYYWSPSLVNIATNRAVINSSYSVGKYNNYFKCSIINFFGEFTKFKRELSDKRVETIDFYNSNLINFFPKHGKVSSRFSFLLIFLLSFFPLKNLIQKKKPAYLIIHLITSLPLILLIFFKFETKFVLRISGLPKMNFLRKLLWKIAFKKIYKVTCPTQNTLSYIRSLKIISDEKISLLYDPIINVAEINDKKKQYKLDKSDYFLAVGRLTKQKDFMFLCKAFKKIINKNKDIKLFIAGDGEDRDKIINYIKKKRLDKNIFLLGHVENIFPYFTNARAFILTSLWEDPGFVLVEAAFSRTLILCNNSKPGPNELIKNDYNGIVYQTGSIDDFKLKFDKVLKLQNINTLKKNSLKRTKRFTIFSHYQQLKNIILDKEF